MAVCSEAAIRDRLQMTDARLTNCTTYLVFKPLGRLASYATPIGQRLRLLPLQAILQDGRLTQTDLLIRLDI